jgi:hypothetical protein
MQQVHPRGYFKAHYYATYYYASVIRDWLEDPLAVTTLTEGFWCDGEILHYSVPFRRASALHAFIRFVVYTLLHQRNDEAQLEHNQNVYRNYMHMREALAEMQPDALAINLEMAGHGVAHETFAEWLSTNGKTFLEADADDIYEYHQNLALSEEFDCFATQIAEEVFFLLFQNRHVLLRFNEWMAAHLLPSDPEAELDGEYRRYFTNTGVLKRVTVPIWAKNAVFFRDHGKCTSCLGDISGLIGPQPPRHYDHIVPLIAGGLNDVTNLQLLCAVCNAAKGAGAGVTSAFYQRWY